MPALWTAWDSKSSFRPYLLSVLFVLAAFAGRLSLQPWLNERSPFLAFTVAIGVSAGLFGIMPGLVATLLSLALGILVFMIPDTSSVAFSLDQLVNIGLFIATSAVILVFGEHLRSARARAEQLELQLQHAQNVSAMGTMAATLAHELNQPLAASANYLAACKQIASNFEGDGKNPFLKGLGEAEAQIQRAGAIIRHARTLVANVPAQRKPASIRGMLARVTKVVEANALKGDTRFHTDIELGADQVLVEPIQIEQVLLNIVRNACQAMTASTLAPELLFSAKVAGDRILLEIRDNGPGIPPERLKTLFSASEGSSTGGLGIGLSISRTIIESHGGTLWAQNNPDGGASFFITLPRLEKAARPEEA